MPCINHCVLSSCDGFTSEWGGSQEKLSTAAHACWKKWTCLEDALGGGRVDSRGRCEQAVRPETLGGSVANVPPPSSPVLENLVTEFVKVRSKGLVRAHCVLERFVPSEA